MFIGVRRENDGSLYIDKTIYQRVKKILNENGEEEYVNFTDYELSIPPYSYKKIHVLDEYVKDITIYDFDEDLNFDISKYMSRKNEQLKNEFRKKRIEECFTIINRGQLWYDSLTHSQKEELKIWYQLWLDVTETLIEPQKPNWLK